jgi:hypothetical protein
MTRDAQCSSEQLESCTCSAAPKTRQCSLCLTLDAHFSAGDASDLPGRHISQTSFPVKWKCIPAYLLFLSWPLIGRNLNMLCNNVNKTVLATVNTKDIFFCSVWKFYAFSCDEVLIKLICFVFKWGGRGCSFPLATFWLQPCFYVPLHLRHCLYVIAQVKLEEGWDLEPQTRDPPLSIHWHV